MNQVHHTSIPSIDSPQPNATAAFSSARVADDDDADRSLAKPSSNSNIHNYFDPFDELLMDQQATINVGCVGHVSHGKTTVVKWLTGIDTGRFCSEKQRNMTIRLGYANAKIWLCKVCGTYKSTGSGVSIRRPPRCAARHPSQAMRLRRHISFVDCPGHEMLMATMLNGATAMDAAVMVIAADAHCPQVQTENHLMALEFMNLARDSVMVIQNKVDLVSRDEAKANHDDMRAFLSGSRVASNSVIIPASAHSGANLDLLCRFICEKLPTPARCIEPVTLPPRMLVVRSFDVNHPGCLIDELVGGIAGGTLLRGTLCIGDEIELRPGVIRRCARGASVFECVPLRTRVVSLKSESNALQQAFPGGLIAVGTTVDPTLARSDHLVGQIIGRPGTMPDIYAAVTISYRFLKKIIASDESEESTVANESPIESRKTLSSKTTQSIDSDENDDSHLRRRFAPNEELLLTINTATVKANVVKKHTSRTNKIRQILVQLQLPICADLESRVTISRRATNKRWRLAAYGTLISGDVIAPTTRPTLR